MSVDIDGKVIGKKYTSAFEYDANKNPIYIGRAEIGTPKSSTGWAIMKLTFDVNNNPTDIQWADGVDSLSKVWNNRASYTYS